MSLALFLSACLNSFLAWKLYRRKLRLVKKPKLAPVIPLKQTSPDLTKVRTQPGKFYVDFPHLGETFTCIWHPVYEAKGFIAKTFITSILYFDQSAVEVPVPGDDLALARVRKAQKGGSIASTRTVWIDPVAMKYYE